MKKDYLNELYGRVDYLHNTLNEPLKTPRYEMMNAILKGLFSHALNVMKNILLDQTLSLGTAINGVKVLEYYAVLEWLKKQPNPEKTYTLYQDWYAIKRYKMVAQFPDYDDVLFDINTLKEAHDQAIIRYQKRNPELLESELPFTEDENLTYDVLVEEHLPNEQTKYINDYRYLKLLTRPHSYGDLKQEPQLKGIYFKILIVVDILSKRAKDHPELRNFESISAPFLKESTEESTFYEALQEQLNVLNNVKKQFIHQYKRHVMADYLNEVMLLSEDIHSDYLMGFGGAMKRKWGLIVEMMSIFNQANNDTLLLMRMHTDYHKFLVFKPLSPHRETLLEKAYDQYQKMYPNSHTIETFEKLFKEPLGYFTDTTMNVPTASSMALALLKQQFKSNPKKIDKRPEELLSIAYREGRLFDTVLASHDALSNITKREAQNILFAMDHLIMATLYSVQRRYEYASKQHPETDYRLLIETINKTIKAYFKLTNRKHTYFKQTNTTNVKPSYVQ